MDDRTAFAIGWLLNSDEPAVRMMTRRDLLGRPANGDSGHVLDGQWVQALLDGQRANGGFGNHAYSKWTGAHWRLVSLAELEVPPGEPRVMAATDQVLEWLTGPRRRPPPVVSGLARFCASMEGNALAACSRLGLADDLRVRRLAERLVEWQWPDGGWNCDAKASGRRSSFHESLPPAWGLYEFARATGDRAAAEAARDAAARTAELFLSHQLLRSLNTGEVIKKEWLSLRYPAYWHYNVLQALVILARMGVAGDPRTAEALDLVERRRLPDGRWRPGGYWWAGVGSVRMPEVVDWGRSEPNQMITLNALRVLRASGRLA